MYTVCICIYNPRRLVLLLFLAQRLAIAHHLKASRMIFRLEDSFLRAALKLSDEGSRRHQLPSLLLQKPCITSEPRRVVSTL